jgi:hypothetical protein
MNEAGIQDVGSRLTGRLVTALGRMQRLVTQTKSIPADP